MRVALIHAYSATNSGDGLLVEEARELVVEAFPDAEVILLALDGQSFPRERYAAVLHPLGGHRLQLPGRETVRLGLLNLVANRGSKAVRRVLEQCDLMVAVGGGYLRSKHPVEALKMIASHGPQLRFDQASRIYLPQSIGPLRYGTHLMVRRSLRRAAAVYVRDERSAKELSGLTNVARQPDMAILGLPAVWHRDRVAGPSGPIGIVARDLPGSKRSIGSYRLALGRLLDALPDAELLIQATARGNNDGEFYRSHFKGRVSDRLLRDAVSADVAERPSLVISVRLHGAIESIRSGVPSIHLSYERKGWGAYEDLGILPYVHNAFNFDSGAVARQAIDLRANPSAFWDGVEGSIGHLHDARSQLINSLRDSIAGSS